MRLMAYRVVQAVTAFKAFAQENGADGQAWIDELPEPAGELLNETLSLAQTLTLSDVDARRLSDGRIYSAQDMLVQMRHKLKES